MVKIVFHVPAQRLRIEMISVRWSYHRPDFGKGVDGVEETLEPFAK